MTTKNLSDPHLDQHLRHVLRSVAETAVPDMRSATAPPVKPRVGRSRRRMGLVIGVAVIPISLAAAAVVRSGPEYVDRIPPETILVTGSVDGSRYMLVETRRTACGGPVDGVELVEEQENLLGSEWNTVGEAYGEWVDECRLDTTRYLANPALYNDGGARVGNSMVWIWAVHPSVTGVRITMPTGVQTLPIHRVDGAGYALFEVPRGIATFTAELVIDEAVVPGSAERHLVSIPE